MDVFEQIILDIQKTPGLPEDVQKTLQDIFNMLPTMTENQLVQVSQYLEQLNDTIEASLILADLSNVDAQRGYTKLEELAAQALVDLKVPVVFEDPFEEEGIDILQGIKRGRGYKEGTFKKQKTYDPMQ